MYLPTRICNSISSIKIFFWHKEIGRSYLRELEHYDKTVFWPCIQWLEGDDHIVTNTFNDVLVDFLVLWKYWYDHSRDNITTTHVYFVYVTFIHSRPWLKNSDNWHRQVLYFWPSLVHYYLKKRKINRNWFRNPIWDQMLPLPISCTFDFRFYLKDFIYQ